MLITTCVHSHAPILPQDVPTTISTRKTNHVINESFASLVSSLMYLAQRSRPDILKEVALFSTKTSSPTNINLQQLHTICQYIKSTKSMTYDINVQTCPSLYMLTPHTTATVMTASPTVEERSSSVPITQLLNAYLRSSVLTTASVQLLKKRSTEKV